MGLEFKALEKLILLSGFLEAGLNLNQALDQLAQRLGQPWEPNASIELKINCLFPQPSLSFVRSLLVVGNQGGGELRLFIQQAARFIQMEQEMKNKAKALSANTRGTAWIVGSAPFVFLALEAVVVPELVRPFFQHPFGWICLGAMIVLTSIGGVVAYRMARLD